MSPQAPTHMPCQIYLITPPIIDDMAVFLATLDRTLAAVPSNAPIACLQVRLKHLDDTALLQAARAMKTIVHKHQTLLIINDRPDIAKAVGADGVHIGQSDMDYLSSRELLGKDAIIGVTCHNSKDLALSAAESGADYVAFGAVFETQTKDAPTRCDMEILKWWNLFIEIPSVAIGGITVENAQSVIEAGADFIALSAGVWAHSAGPEIAVQTLSKLCLNSHLATQ